MKQLEPSFVGSITRRTRYFDLIIYIQMIRTFLDETTLWALRDFASSAICCWKTSTAARRALANFSFSSSTVLQTLHMFLKIDNKYKLIINNNQEYNIRLKSDMNRFFIYILCDIFIIVTYRLYYSSYLDFMYVC